MVELRQRGSGHFISLQDAKDALHCLRDTVFPMDEISIISGGNVINSSDFLHGECEDFEWERPPTDLYVTVEGIHEDLLRAEATFSCHCIQDWNVFDLPP